MALLTNQVQDDVSLKELLTPTILVHFSNLHIFVLRYPEEMPFYCPLISEFAQFLQLAPTMGCLSPERIRRVAIIGAGPGGVVAAK